MHRLQLLGRALPIAGLLLPGSLCAQLTVSGGSMDTNYVRDLSGRITARIALSHKFDGFIARSQDERLALRFRPNGSLNLVLGLGHQRVALNLGFKLPFINEDDLEKGRSRTLAVQGDVIGAHTVTSLMVRWVRGYHLPSQPFVADGRSDGSTQFPYRSDIQQVSVGLGMLRVLNAERFSFRAFVMQDAIQRRSQGSWLLGSFASFHRITADSALVPRSLVLEEPSVRDVANVTDLMMGPMAGFAYTHVIDERFFATVSAAAGPGANLHVEQRWIGHFAPASFDLRPGVYVQWRAAIGLNRDTHFIGLLYEQEYQGYPSIGALRMDHETGRYRAVFAYRFGSGPIGVKRLFHWLKRRSDELKEPLT